MPKGAFLHPACERRLSFLSGPVCMKCGGPIASEEAEYCEKCAVSDRGWDMGRSAYPYQGTAGSIIRTIKNEGTEEFVRFFAAQLHISQKSYLYRTGAECIVPVPLHPEKLRRRGFNQAELLAEALSRETGIPVRLLLNKEKKTKEQKHLTKTQRQTNVKDVYRVDETVLGRELPQTVLLLDDIITTGSTLTACARVLKKAGIKKVYFLTVCAGE